MEAQWDKKSFLRELITMARTRDIDIDEITVSPALYDEFNRLAVYSRTYDQDVSETCLRFYDVKINKRKCKGCCTHG